MLQLGPVQTAEQRKRKPVSGYWRMAGTSMVQRALDYRWLTGRGVPSIRQQWIEMHYGWRKRLLNPEAVHPTGTA